MRETALAVLSAAMAWLWLCPAGAGDTIPVGLPDDLVCKSAEPSRHVRWPARPQRSFGGVPFRLPEGREAG
jgi:hypothetical protein